MDLYLVQEVDHLAKDHLAEDHLAKDHLAGDHLAEGRQQYYLWAPAVDHQEQEALEDVAAGAGEAVHCPVHP